MDFLFLDISNLKKKNVTEKTQVVVKSERYLWDRADNRNWTTDQKYKKKQMTNNYLPNIRFILEVSFILGW